MSEVSNVITDDLKEIIKVLDEDDANAIVQLREELSDNWKKKQIFRTEVEMRISVLNDAKHPTQSAKYWQSVREMSAMFDALMGLSFDLRRNEVKRLKLERKMEKAKSGEDDLKIKEIQIDLDENLYQRANMKQVASDRIRELKLWSKIKSELDDGTVDTTYVGNDQFETYKHYWNNRVNSLNQNSDVGDVMNALGPMMSINKLASEDGKLLSFAEAKKRIAQSSQQQENK